MILSSFFCILLNIQGQSQNNFSLQQSIDFALKNQPKMKSILIDEQLTIEKNKEILGIALPQVKATGQFQYLFITPTQRSSADAFDFSSSLSFFKIDTPAYMAYKNKPKQKYMELKFGLPLNASAGIQVTQILFDAGVLVALQARQSLEDLAKLNTERTEEEIRLSVSKAYYNCVIAKKRMSLIDENITLLSSLENMTTKLFQEGFAERIDADRISVQKNNLLTEKTKIQNLIDLSYALLKFQMGMNIEQNITLTDDINTEAVKNNLDLDKVLDYNNRIEMNLLQMAKKLNRYDLIRYQKGFLPTIVAAVSGSYNSQTKAFTELFTLPYFPTGAFVLNASMPLYDGGTRRAKMQQAKLNIQKNEIDIEAFKQAVNLESSNARTQLTNSMMSLDAQENNIALAKKVMTIAQKKYKEGLGTNIEILQAETALKEAQTNYYNSLYEAIIAKLEFQKSLGLLK